MGKLICIVLTLACATAAAETPEQVFKQVSPSVVVIQVSGSDGKPIGQGSGVAIQKGVLITNCHVANSGPKLEVDEANNKLSATVLFADTDADLCELSVPHLTTPSITLGRSHDLQVGQTVYAVGAPEGLELTISSGLISGLRSGGIIQTSAPISPGSSGGGLFDEQGRLIGITTFYFSEGQNLNFAMPVDWIADLPARAKAETSIHKSTGEDQWVLAGAVYEGKSDWQNLRKLGEAWTAQRPDSSVAWVGLAEAYDGLGQYDKALQAYQTVVQLDPSDVDAWVRLGGVYESLGRYELEASALRVAIRLKPDCVEAWAGLGSVYISLKNLTQAVSANLEAIRLKPDLEMAWVNLGIAYAQLDKYEMAVVPLTQAVQLKPDDGKAWYVLGLDYGLLGQTSKAIDVYKQLKAIDLKQAEDLFRMAILPRLIDGGTMESSKNPVSNLSTPDSSCSPAIESQIDGDFEGWSGDTLFKLTNGEIWEQAEYDYTYEYDLMPAVTIYPTDNGCKMKVDGMDETILVKRIK